MAWQRVVGVRLWTGGDRKGLSNEQKLMAVRSAMRKLQKAQAGKRSKFVVRLEGEAKRLVEAGGAS